MSQDLVKKAKEAVSLKMASLRANCNDLAEVSIPDLSDLSESESEILPEKINTENKKVKEEDTNDSNTTKTYNKRKMEVDKLMKKAATVTKYNEGLREGKKRRRLEREKTKGKGWFDLPATEMDKDTMMDFQIIRMRGILNPKHFFKKFDTRATLPKYFQMGTIKDSPAEFYSGRIPKKQRRHHLIDELLADPNFKRYQKRKYAEISTKSKRA